MLRTALAAATAAFVAGAAAAQSLLPEPSAGTDAYPVVLTPARLRQSLQDVPASVTIVTAETLARYGITNLPDALRLVPGMQITQPSGNDYRINYHGTNLLTPRRMNVLIDGVSVYQPAFSRVDWKNLPVAIEDIDRIEVTRGPDSAAYGPNSMLGIVNIITRHPSDVERGLVAATFGSLGTARLTGRLGATFGSTSLRLTASTEHDRGYDFMARIGGDHDSTHLNRLNLRSQTRLGSTATLDVDAGYVGGIKEVPFVEPFQATAPDQRVEDFYLSATLTKNFSPNHELQVRGTYWSNQVRQAWTSCPPSALFVPELFALWQANPAYASALLARRTPSGGSASDDALAVAASAAITRLGARALQPTCATANQNLAERRVAIELQDTYVVSERLRGVAGVGARHQQGNSDTYLAGTVSNSIWWAFANAEYKPRAWLSLNVGGYAEHDALSGRTNTSPRIAANLRLPANQALRFVWSTGTRTPDIQEQRANWTYTSDDASPLLNGSSRVRFFQSAKSPGGLRSERITSREIGYLLNRPALGLLFDAKVFDDHLTDLISEKLQVSGFMPTNNGSVHLSGAELQAGVELSSAWSGFVNYAYLLNRDASNPTERTQYSRHSGSLGVSHRFGNGWTGSLAYYGASGDGLGEQRYGREDVTVSKAFRLDGARVAASISLRRLDNRTATYYRDAGSFPESVYNNRLQVFGHVRIGF